MATDDGWECDCWHEDACHEATVRVSRTWFSVALAEEQGLLDEAKTNGNVWWWCSVCGDSCRNATDDEIEQCRDSEDERGLTGGET